MKRHNYFIFHGHININHYFYRVLKQVITIFLALLVFSQPFTNVWIVVSFKLNQERIAETLCVQKDIPENACQGNCQLMKRLKKADQAEQQQAPFALKIKAEVLFCHQPANLEIQADFPRDNESENALYHRSHAITAVDDIFHPPKATRFLLV